MAAPTIQDATGDSRLVGKLFLIAFLMQLMTGVFLFLQLHEAPTLVCSGGQGAMTCDEVREGIPFVEIAYTVIFAAIFVVGLSYLYEARVFTSTKKAPVEPKATG